MKAILLLLLAFISPVLWAQQGINYQAVVRDGSGALIKNQNVTVEFSVRETTAGGTKIYTESHTAATNDYGVINVIIGKGTPSLSTFDAVDWGSDRHFLSIKINGTTLGTIEFRWVPYSLHAQTLTNIKTNTSIADLEMTSDGDYARIHLRPTVATTNDSSSIFFGEGSIEENGMAITYDGVSNTMKFTGHTFTSNEGTALTLYRTSGRAVFTKGVEVEETTTSPDENKVYGNSMPIAYAYVSGTTATQDYGITSITNATTGVYIITLDNNFSGSPVVIATSFNNSSDTEIVTYSFSSTNKINIRIVNESNTAINSNFSVVVFGTPQ